MEKGSDFELECVICRRNIILPCSDVPGIKRPEENLEQFLQVLVPGSKSFRTAQHDKFNSAMVNSSEDILVTDFCEKCTLKITEVYRVHHEIQRLSDRLAELRSLLQTEFRNSFDQNECMATDLADSNTQVGGVNAYQRGKARLSLAKCLGLIEESDEVSNDNWSCDVSIVDGRTGVKELAKGNMTSPKQEDLYSHLKQHFKLKDVVVRLDRLTPDILSARGSHFVQRIPRKRGRPRKIPYNSEGNQSFTTGAYSSKGNFLRKKSLNKHAKQLHGSRGLQVAAGDESLEVTLLPRKRFKCVYRQCSNSSKERFRTIEERDSHIKACHGEYTPDDLSDEPLEDPGEELFMIAEGNSEEQAEKPRKRRGRYREGAKDRKVQLQCDVPNCTRRRYFNSQYMLEMHKKKVHEGILRPFVCKDKECNLSFPENRMCESHYRVVHLGIKKHICQVCGHAFSLSTNLKKHLAVHTKERNYSCDVCQQSFKTDYGLLIHKRYVHTGERPYSCDRCGKCFVSALKMNNHIKCVHNKHERPFICHICGKGFPINGYLYMHLRNSHQIGLKKVENNDADSDMTSQLQDELEKTPIKSKDIVAQECGKSGDSPAKSTADLSSLHDLASGDQQLSGSIETPSYASPETHASSSSSFHQPNYVLEEAYRTANNSGNC